MNENFVKTYYLESPPIPPAPEYRLKRCVRELEEISESDLNKTTIADIGCNQGQLCAYINHLYPKCRIHGVDDYVIVTANGEEPYPNFNYQGHNLAQSIPYETGFLDAAFALEVLEHMIDTDYFLDECLRVLKPKGWLIITTPNICGLRNRINVPLGKYPAMLEYKNIIHHVRLYNKAALNSHLLERGFTNITIKGTAYVAHEVFRDQPLCSKSI